MLIHPTALAVLPLPSAPSTRDFGPATSPHPITLLASTRPRPRRRHPTMRSLISTPAQGTISTLFHVFHTACYTQRGHPRVELGVTRIHGSAESAQASSAADSPVCRDLPRCPNQNRFMLDSSRPKRRTQHAEQRGSAGTIQRRITATVESGARRSYTLPAARQGSPLSTRQKAA